MTSRRFVLTLCSLLLLAGCTREMSWPLVERMVSSSYPDVRQITTDSLARALDGAQDSAPVLLDVRTTDEYNVSHLEGAIRIDPETSDFSALDSLRDGSPIVTYCSVGYRSAAMADRLRKAGFSNVSNLRGSIFQWANEGRPLYRDGARVEKVHPYDKIWGRLLDPKLRAGMD